MSQSLAAWVRVHSKSRPSKKVLNLTAARASVRLVVVKIENGEGGVSAAVVGRLGDLGLGPGEVFEYFGQAPLGEPIFICVRETVLALRLEEAALIHVVDEASGSAGGESPRGRA